ncbi:hypothetical protein F3157_00180 [Virgibacillus dakarensis]|uniref:DUF4190 domain-containing protein n=1 Tax=Lentibacillus populi TaxID=1827502 RepID=A0A9W5TUK5_9BACI|nr:MULTISPECIES: DUF4190 domain-containing protein [Bacillaceae]MBT2214481.1 hypothetical protein [Virgibacillus dakarensis]MTW84086.1 hypothetical protein [Virgibacillus dakarensis]GGB29186.1 hypothetical protein GCM10011409_03170 [Lentibacillus populi]
MDDFERYQNRSQNNQGEQQDDQDIVGTNLTGQNPSAFNPTRKANDEETAAELTADDLDTPSRIEDDDDTNASSTYGWVALALSIVSFFWLPIILGGAGIIVGFIARSRGANTLGMTAIIAGAVSILISLFILPFV